MSITAGFWMFFLVSLFLATANLMQSKTIKTQGKTINQWVRRYNREASIPVAPPYDQEAEGVWKT